MEPPTSLKPPDLLLVAFSAQLAQRFTLINYDRRGRGDSGDTAPYAVEREIEDLGALIAVAGGTASVYGHSSEPQESFGG